MSWVRIGSQVTLGVAAILISLYLLYLLSSVVVSVLIAIIFAQAISPLVIRIRRLGARRTQAVLAVYLLLAIGVVALLWLMEQAVTTEAGNFANSLPTIQYQLYQTISQIPWRPVREAALQALGQVNEPSIAVPAEVPFRLLETGRAVAEVVFGAFSVLLIAFFWISERLVIRNTLVRLLASRHRQRSLQIWDDVEDKLGAWVRAELVLMAVVAVGFTVGLTALGVKYAVLLGVFAGLMQLVPMIGPMIGTAPAVLVALTQSPELALLTTGLGILVHVIEGNILLPRVMRHTMGVSPLTVILGILVGAKLMGVPGALLAVPVAAGVQVLLTDLGVFEDRPPPVEVPLLEIPGAAAVHRPAPEETEPAA